MLYNVCWFLLYINMNQSQIYICPLPLEPFSHLPIPSYSPKFSQSTKLHFLLYTTTSH